MKKNYFIHLKREIGLNVYNSIFYASFKTEEEFKIGLINLEYALLMAHVYKETKIKNNGTMAYVYIK